MGKNARRKGEKGRRERKGDGGGEGGGERETEREREERVTKRREEGGGNGVCLYTTLISIFFPTRNVFNSSET